jgi:hypothetical protein
MFISVIFILVTSHGGMQYFISIFLIAFAHQRAFSFEHGTLIEADNLATLRLFRRSVNVFCTKQLKKNIAYIGL